MGSRALDNSMTLWAAKRTAIVGNHAGGSTTAMQTSKPYTLGMHTTVADRSNLSPQPLGRGTYKAANSTTLAHDTLLDPL